jgi:hypothetical protein
MPDCELLRDNELPLLLEVVRSKRRVWYAKGPEEDPDLELEALDGFELEGSIFWTFHQRAESNKPAMVTLTSST